MICNHDCQFMIKCLLDIFVCLTLNIRLTDSIIARRHACHLLKLTKEVLWAPIATAGCYFRNAYTTCYQVFLGHIYPAPDNIFHAAYAEGSLIGCFKIACTDAKFFCHHGQVPVDLRFSEDFSAQIINISDRKRYVARFIALN